MPSHAGRRTRSFWARALYGERVDAMAWPKVYDTVHTQVTRLRAKLEPLGIEIVTNGKRGWTLALPAGEGHGGLQLGR